MGTMAEPVRGPSTENLYRQATAELMGHGLVDVADAVAFATRRIGRAKIRSQGFARWLYHRASEGRISLFRRRVSDQMHACCSSVVLGRSAGRLRVAGAIRCGRHLLCETCAIFRGLEILRRMVPVYTQVSKDSPDFSWKLVTLTVKNGPDLAERIEHLRASYRRLEQCRRDELRGKGRQWSQYWTQQAGGLGSIEVTRNKETGEWHPHLHLVVCSYQPYGKDDTSRMAADWWAATGDSYVVDVRELRTEGGPAKNLAEVAKYALKAAGLDNPSRLIAWETMRGRRLFLTFGALRGVELEPSEAPLLESLIPLSWQAGRFVPGGASLWLFQWLSILGRGGTVSDPQLTDIGRLRGPAPSSSDPP